MDHRILKLAAKKMAKGATIAELNELQELLSKDPDAEETLRIIAEMKFISSPVYDSSANGINKQHVKIIERISYSQDSQIGKLCLNYKNGNLN